MSEFSIRSYVSRTTSFFAENCPSLLPQRQTAIKVVALAALGILSYTLYRYLTKISSPLAAVPKENQKLRKLQTKIQEEKKTTSEENQAISLSLPYRDVKKIRLYQRLDELVRKGFIHSWVRSDGLSVYIKCKQEDSLLPYQTCDLNALPNNRSGWRDQNLVALEDNFKKEHPLKEPEEAALQELTLEQRESIQDVLVELKVRGKPGACHFLSSDSSTTHTLSFLKTHGVIHDFKKPKYYGSSCKVFITTQDQEIEKKIKSLVFPQHYDLSIKNCIKEAYRQRLTENKLAAFMIQVHLTFDSEKLDNLVRTGMISWRRLKAEKNSLTSPVLIRFSADDPVEQDEEAFDHTEYPHMKAGWRTREHLEHEDTLRSVNKVVINDEALRSFFETCSDEDRRKCEVLLFRLNKRVQTGPYLLKDLGAIELLFVEFLQKYKAIFKIEWLNTLRTECNVFVREFDCIV